MLQWSPSLQARWASRQRSDGYASSMDKEALEDYRQTRKREFMLTLCLCEHGQDVSKGWRQRWWFSTVQLKDPDYLCKYVSVDDLCKIIICSLTRNPKILGCVWKPIPTPSVVGMGTGNFPRSVLLHKSLSGFVEAAMLKHSKRDGYVLWFYTDGKELANESVDVTATRVTHHEHEDVNPMKAEPKEAEPALSEVTHAREAPNQYEQEDVNPIKVESTDSWSTLAEAARVGPVNAEIPSVGSAENGPALVEEGRQASRPRGDEESPANTDEDNDGRHHSPPVAGSPPSEAINTLERRRQSRADQTRHTTRVKGEEE